MICYLLQPNIFLLEPTLKCWMVSRKLPACTCPWLAPSRIIPVSLAQPCCRGRGSRSPWGSGAEAEARPALSGKAVRGKLITGPGTPSLTGPLLSSEVLISSSSLGPAIPRHFPSHQAPCCAPLADIQPGHRLIPSPVTRRRK